MGAGAGQAGWDVWHLFRLASRPTLARSGGTALIYEIDPYGSPADHRPQAMADALKARVDPTGSENVTVRTVGDTRFEVGIRRRGDHEAHVERAKELIAQAGSLEFRVLANEKDDAEAVAPTRRALAWACAAPAFQAGAHVRVGSPFPTRRPRQT